MTSIGFIFPSSDYLFDPFRGDPFTHFHILTILEHTFGKDVDLHLIDLRGIKKEFAIYHIPQCDLYLHSIYTLDFAEQVSIIENIKDRYPEARHIAGGPHVNVFPDQCSELVDSIIMGEGEGSIVQAVRDFQENALKPRYAESPMVDLNDYPYWRRHYLPKSAVVRRGLMSLRRQAGYENLIGTTAMFSRGCPYSCAFCAMNHIREHAPGIRFRSPHLVAEEIKYLQRDYGVQGLVLTDEIGIPLKHDHAVKHLDAIGSTGIVWRGQCRVDGITDEVAKLAKASGCIALGMGIESVHQKSLDIINKKISIARAREAIGHLKKHGIEARLYLILGLPGEPPDIVEQTWRFIEETDPDLVYLSLFTIRPGTDVYKNPEKYGIKSISHDWEKTMHLYGRYEDELPTLTFQYHENTAWGKSIPAEQIIQNYLELQRRLKDKGMSSIPQREPTKSKHGLLTATALGA